MGGSAQDVPPALLEPFTTDVIHEVRTGKIQNMPGLTIPTGIFKTTHSTRAEVTEMGIEGDEHDYTFHGGADKAIHGYCRVHYDHWRAAHPDRADKFVPGGFGENLVLQKMNERNICIGDVFEVSAPEPEKEGVRLQISLPRQPCFKLNHRFGIRDFAPTTFRSSRTGFYFRVLRGGTIGKGDTIKLVERINPKWTVERVQEYLHRNTQDEAMNAELAEIEALGVESKSIFAKRVAQAEKAKRKKELGFLDDKKEKWREYRVVCRKGETPRIMSFQLEAIDPSPDTDEGIKPGSHARLRLQNGLIRSYSIVGGSRKRFEIGVALADSSRGGSRHLHTEVDVGKLLEVGNITESVPPSASSGKHVFIAGGIGITAFLPLMELMRKINWQVECHYGVRSHGDIPFRQRIDGLGATVTIYAKDEGQRMDVKRVFADLAWNEHLYVCGPPRLMEAVAAEAKAKRLSEDDIHYEAFQANAGGDPFDVVVQNRGNKELRVCEDETLLEVLRRDIEDVPSSCEAGNCGTCKIYLKKGRVDHRGTGLLEGMKEEFMLSCVSRGVGKITVEL